MNWVDAGRWVISSVFSHGFRSLLTALGMAVGIASVTLLTAIGEGVQHYVLDSFSQFGARII
ncbi:MAG: ABC transporter permease, partial [Cycloclasticus sp.]